MLDFEIYDGETADTKILIVIDEKNDVVTKFICSEKQLLILKKKIDNFFKNIEVE